MSIDDMKDLLAKFGMVIGRDESPAADLPLQRAQLAHALVGAFEAHATRAEEAYRSAGAEPGDLAYASLMAFAATNCQNHTDELALINWRATRLAGVLSALDFPGPIAREGQCGSGDTLIRTIRLTAAALSGMTRAALAASNPRRGDGEAAASGHVLIRSMDALEEAATDIHLHRATGHLMGTVD